MHSSSSSIDVNGSMTKFKNRRCHCGRKVRVRISKLTNNPDNLSREEFNIYDKKTSQCRERINQHTQIEMHSLDQIENITL